MDVEELRKNLLENSDPDGPCIEDDLMREAATALSTLQAENEKLRAEADGMRSNWYKAVEEVNNLRSELDEKEKYYDQMIDALSATDSTELERVKRERDAAVSWAQKYTESIDMPCVACKHNTGDYVCTAICGNCGPMGAESCKWEFDFSGELKED